MAKPIRVLFVEDSEDDLLILLRELKQGGYTPTYKRVDNGGDLRLAVNNESWDVVISDYKMPHFNAPDALQYLKECGLDIPFIVVSGAIQEEVAVAVMREGAHDYLMKDNLTRLVPAIDREILEAANRRERKRAEDLLLRLGRIIDQASNEIYVFDAKTLQLIQTNRSAQQNLDYSDKTLSGLSWFDLQPEVSAQTFAEWTAALQRGEQDLITYETIQRRGDNTFYPVEVRLHFSRTEIPPVLVAIVQDITKRKAAERELQAAYEKEAAARREAERANAMKNQFLGMVSHELRTPLAAIKGFSSSLLDTDVTWDKADQHQFISIIDEEADKLRDLIDQLLDLSQLQAGVLRIQPEPQSLKIIFDNAHSQLGSVSAKHPLEIALVDELPPVMVDTNRIAQVLVNLVNNAAKFSEESRPITVTVVKRDDFVEISVHDEGIGIPPEDREIIFEAFRQIESRNGRNIKGAGLGLAICKGLVEAHGGQIWVQDQPTPGTTISFTLPVVRQAAH